MLMSKDEIKNSVCWPANGRSPIDRDTQIQIMSTAKERHDNHIKRMLTSLKTRDRVIPLDGDIQ